MKALPNRTLQWDAHTRAQIKSRTQLNVVYAEVSAPELCKLDSVGQCLEFVKMVLFGFTRDQSMVNIKRPYA